MSPLPGAGIGSFVFWTAYWFSFVRGNLRGPDFFNFYAAAKLYITWFLAKEQQSRTGTWSTRLDVPPPSGLKPIFDYQLANEFRSFITNDKLTEELRKRFENYIGKPKGEPVIR